MVNHIKNVLQDLKEEIEFLIETNTGYIADLYPIIIKNIFEQSINPINLEDSELPAIFFGYGESRQNDSIIKPANHRGETSIILVYAVVNSLQDGDLINRATDMQTAIRMIVVGNQNLGNEVSGKRFTKQVRFARSRPFAPKSKGVSRRAFIEFSIEVDHVYSML